MLTIADQQYGPLEGTHVWSHWLSLGAPLTSPLEATPYQSGGSRREGYYLSRDDERPTLAALYVRNREAMLRAARAILRNQHDAEDAVSAAVVKVAARLAAGHVPEEPDAYLIQAVRNAALDHLRASSRRRSQQQNSAEESAVQSVHAGAPPAPANIVDAGPDIADLIIERQRNLEVRAAVHRAIDRLANRERTMLALLLDGHTRADIGTLFNLSGQRVGQLLKQPVGDLLAELGISPAGRHPQPATGQRRSKSTVNEAVVAGGVRRDGTTPKAAEHAE